MSRKLVALFVFVFSLWAFNAYSAQLTKRINQLSNDKVNVWESVIYPNKNEALPMHRHDNPRVLVALTDGVLKVTSDKGQSHLLTLKKDKSYYLPPDPQGEMHTDENITRRPIRLILIELK